MRAVISSDWHGDAYTDGVPRAPDVEAAVFQAMQYAVDNDADAFIFTGDLTDPHVSRSHAAVAHALRVASAMEREGIMSVWLPGNHDVIEDGSGGHTLMALREAGHTVWDRPGLYALGSTSDDDTSVIALPFTPASHSYDPDQVVRDIHKEHGAIESLLVLGHLNIDGMHPGSETKEMPRGRDVMWPLAALSECYPKATLVGGHYHRPQVAKGVNIVGAPIRFTHGEEDNNPGFVVVDI